MQGAGYDPRPGRFAILTGNVAAGPNYVGCRRVDLLDQPDVGRFLENRIDDAISRHAAIGLMKRCDQLAVAVHVSHNGPGAGEFSRDRVEALTPEQRNAPCLSSK